MFISRRPPIILGNNVVDRVPFYKLLGLYIGNDLRENYHIDHVFKKASKRLFSLRMLRKARVSIRLILKVYLTTICRPILEYGAQVWKDILPAFPISLNQFREDPCLLYIHPSAMRTPKSISQVTLMTTISGQRRPVIPRHATKGTCALIYYLQSSVQCVNDKSSSIYVYYI